MSDPRENSGIRASHWHRAADGGSPTSPSPAALPEPLPERSEVVVVGAGIAGLLVAHELTRRGRTVTVLDRSTPASGTTRSSTAKVTALHGASITTVRRHHGSDGAASYAQANLAGVQQVRTVVDALGDDVGWVPGPATTYTTDPARAEHLETEAAAATAAGLRVRLVDGLDLPVAVIRGLVLDDQAAVDPVRLAAALVAALRNSGQLVLSDHTVLGVERGPQRATVHTDRGTVLADHVIVTTLAPAIDPLALFARVTPTMSYALAARLDEPAPNGLHLSIDEPSRSIRPVGGDPTVVVLGGGGHRVGEGGDTRAHQQGLRDWAESTFPVRSIGAQWSAHDLVPADAVPFIGATDDAAQLLVATGFRKWGFSSSGAASLLLADLLDGRDNDWAELFDPRRCMPSLASVGETVKGNLTVGRHFVGDHLRRTGPACTHLGCALVRNDSAETWDCPCHGSRFASDGDVLAGPAIEHLEPPPSSG
jgi:glycine/D-amino acid oxidase-like deaminating enzyme